MTDILILILLLVWFLLDRCGIYFTASAEDFVSDCVGQEVQHKQGETPNRKRPGRRSCD